MEKYGIDFGMNQVAQKANELFVDGMNHLAFMYNA